MAKICNDRLIILKNKTQLIFPISRSPGKMSYSILLLTEVCMYVCQCNFESLRHNLNKNLRSNLTASLLIARAGLKRT